MLQRGRQNKKNRPAFRRCLYKPAAQQQSAPVGLTRMSIIGHCTQPASYPGRFRHATHLVSSKGRGTGSPTLEVVVEEDRRLPVLELIATTLQFLLSLLRLRVNEAPAPPAAALTCLTLTLGLKTPNALVARPSRIVMALLS